jgi:hypothetical protein
MKVESPNFIYVWDCCGALGFTIPWAEWHCQGIYPARPHQRRPHIYIYSLRGQLGDKDKERLAAPNPIATCKGIINVDDYLTIDLRVDWRVVLAGIFDINSKEVPGL